MSEQEIESQIQSKGLTAPRITPADVDHEIVEAQFHVFEGTTLTVCCLKLRNGFVVTGESAAASPENFDQEIGERIAMDNAREKVWPLLGFRLRDALAELQPSTFNERVIRERADLDAKLHKLQTFIIGSEAFSELPADERDRLHAQYAAMSDYSQVLAERIAAFAK